MTNLLSPLDLTIFFASLLAVMGVGLWAGRKEDTPEDYYLAGRSARWWGVAGSVFGSNVSANHIVGMMGVGFAVGFAQSHFEITAVCGLLALCYLFLPIYRRLNVYTLSEYLSQRYNDACRVAYALIMIVIMVVVQMVPGFYIGSRSLNLLLLNHGETATARAVVASDGRVDRLKIVQAGAGYVSDPVVEISPPTLSTATGLSSPALATARHGEGRVIDIEVTAGGNGYDPDNPPTVSLHGGASFERRSRGTPRLGPGDVDPKWYRFGIVLMAIVTGTYVIIGGLKAVIVTDVLQSVLLLLAGMVVAGITFMQPEIGGWAAMAAKDAAGAEKLHLYNPSNDPALPWSGVLSGLMVLHFFYWGTNQFIVQRALAATTLHEARLGIITAGFLKLLIPFFSVGTGIAAYYLFLERGKQVDQDAVFTVLLTDLIAPVGYGLVGLVAAGMIGAILSSLDSMMNSSATIFAFDIYRRFIEPNASDARLILVGRICILVFIVSAALLTIFTMDPNSTSSFFLYIASHQARLVAGVVVAFALGMLWQRATASGALVSIVTGIAVSYGLPPLYERWIGTHEAVAAVFGAELNFLHTVFIAAGMSLIAHVAVSLATTPDPEKGTLTWAGLHIYSPRTILRFGMLLGLTLAIYAVLAALVVQDLLTPGPAGWIAAGWTGLLIVGGSCRGDPSGERPQLRWIDDRLWAAALAALAVFLMFNFA